MTNTVTIIKVRFAAPPLAGDPRKVERLWNYGIKQNKPYKNARCVVSREVMRRKTRRDNEEDV